LQGHVRVTVTMGHELETHRRRSSDPSRAQQARSNLTVRAHTYHHAPAVRLSCNGLLREGSWWASWWGSLDGMQGVRGSNPLSSTRHNASSTALGTVREPPRDSWGRSREW
jgi:hypothetical protein